jgi:DNA repair protein RAD57
VQLAPPRGLEKRAIYISTEAALSTPRLSQMLKSHPDLSSLPPSRAPSLTNILSINAMDLESQDHILNYQVPVAVQRYNVGLVVIDSITANYRAEHTSTTMAALFSRSGELAKLGHLLRSLAASQNIAVVVANQVSDRFADAADSAPYPLRAPRESGGPAPSPAPRNVGGGGGDAAVLTSSPAIQSSPYVDEELAAEGTGNAARSEILSLLHQQRFFTGWGDTRASNPDSDSSGSVHHRPSQKTPALGLVWSTQIACRIALKKERPSDTDVARSCEGEGKGPERVSGNDSQTPNDGEDGKHRVPDPPAGHDQGRRNPMLEAGAEKLTRRVMELVMAPWTGGSAQNRDARDEVEFEIWKSGLSSRLKPE